MKILHVITGLQKAAGTSTFCGEVCNQLVARGHEVTIAVCNPKQRNLYSLDPCVHLVSIDSILHSSTTTFNFDIVHLHGLWSPILHRVSNWAHTHNIPVVWSTHGMTAPWAMRHKWWKKCLPWHLYQKRDLKRARLIHCTSDFEVEWNRKLEFEKTFFAPLGTFLPEIGVGERCRCREEGRTLLFVGRIYPVKALDNLIRAFANAEKQRSRADEKWVLRIVGPDQAGHMAELMALCDRLGLTYVQEKIGVENRCTVDGSFSQSNNQTIKHSNNFRIIFAGPKYGADLDAEYANCDALALVSHTENFGATVVDALAHGKPVVTSTKTPWKVVADNECGWWVDNDVESLSSALVQLFGCSPSELCEMGRRGRALVEEKYTWQAVAKTVEEAYHDAQYDCEFAPCGACEKCYDTCSPERIIQ